MRLMRFSRALILIPALSGGFAQTEFIRANGGPASIEIDFSRAAGYTIPRTIYGAFLEPIGNSVYGGLWAQVLENPSFEENLWSAGNIKKMLQREPALERASQLGLPLPWEPLDSDQGARYEPRWKDAANSARSLLVMALPEKQTGVRQQVHLPVHRALRYTGAVYARLLSGAPGMEISLRRRNHPEITLQRASLALTGQEWARYPFALELSAGQLAPLEPADFVIAVSGETRVLIDQASLFPADAIDGMDPEMIEMARALRTPVVRFGGNFTSAYHWRDGIGPPDRRVSMLNLAWEMPEYNQFGTDEFLRFCQLIGAEPQIALNLGTGTPGEAADWVRYVNAHWGDHSGGLLWELGNELWATFQTGYPTLERVAALTRTFSEEVRKADPRARLIATGADPDHFEQWNAAQLTNPPGTFQLLSTHFVVGDERVLKSGASPEFIAQASFALPVELERRLRAMRRQMAGRSVNIAFTEWLFHGPDDSVPRFSNLGGAICTAGFLNTLMRVAGFTPISDMTGLIEFGGIWKKRGRVYGTPAYWAFRMYSNADATVPVQTRVTADAYNVLEGNVRLPEIRDVPLLDVVAARDDSGRRLTLFCVNRSLDRDIDASIAILGFTPGDRALIHTLAAASIREVNDEARPEVVRPVERELPIAGPRFNYTFEHSTVTVIELTS